MAVITSANVANAIVKLVAADALPALMGNLVMGNLVNRDYEPTLAQAGDTVNVHVKVIEGAKERIQVFKGVVLRRQGGGIRETFTVRKESYGVGVERTFPVHSPNIDHIEVVTHGDVRRAKLYYLRELRGKKAKIKERR